MNTENPSAPAAPTAALPPAFRAGSPRRVAPLRIGRSRRVEQQVAGQATSDGDGVRLTRILTQPLQRRLDPFLMLDAFGSDAAGDYIGGFPDHPHRGFETVTVMLAGRMRHRDSVGNEGLLEPGSIQWMTAGRGLIHSEMPEQTEGRMAGFQLWVNLAAADKMQPPAYRDLPAEQVPLLRLQASEAGQAGEGAADAAQDGVALRLLAGSSHGVAGAVLRPVTEPLVIDALIPPGRALELPLPPGHNAFVQVFAEPGFGSAVDIGSADAPTRVALDRMALLANPRAGDAEPDGVRVAVPATADAPARVLIVAGRPLGEPVVQYGPFVLNSTDQIRQAIADFQTGRLAR